MDQVNELIHHKVSEFLARELETPADVFITLSRVETSPDLRHSRVFVSVIPDNKRGTGLRLLRASRGRLQKYLGKSIHMKYVPKVNFMIDSQAVYGNEIDRLMAGLDIQPEETDDDSEE
jgi:ribosome-binding factor A